MLRCWEKSPDDRPSFDELNGHLQCILHEEAVRTFDPSKCYLYSFGHILSNIIAKATAQKVQPATLAIRDSRLYILSVSFSDTRGKLALLTVIHGLLHK